MWIVFMGMARHSAWEGSAAALHQKEVLEDSGYKHLAVKYDATVNCKNGHYYVYGDILRTY